MSDPTRPPAGEPSDRAVALLRTTVPALWGSVVSWLLVQLAARLPPPVTDLLAILLGSDLATSLAVACTVAAWYALWRWCEPRLPSWLVRLTLGSTRAPRYPRTRPQTDPVRDTPATVEPADGTGATPHF